MSDLISLIEQKFTSGNDVPVERISITRAEYYFAKKITDARALRKENLKLCEGDWAVDDSVLAGKILAVLGIAQDCSLEEGADYRRDYVAAAIAADRKLRGDA